MNKMPVSYSDLVKERKERAKVAHKEIEGDHLNLGKKISVPRDVMMEELALLSNKGSRMFHERQKRVDRFTLENMKEGPLTVQNGTQLLSNSGKENFRTEIYVEQPGKGDFLSTLKKKAAKKSGNPNSIAPGYSGPLKEIPHEKFNITVIPKSYQSPWRESLTDTEELLHSLNQQLPEPPQKPEFRCFNRAPLPFGGTAGYERTFPLPGFELSHAQTEPNLSLARILNRPNFNRAPRGWGVCYSPESAEL
ncbi:myozenin-2-like isoform X1 [Polyodon spathula]|uniref:myozenin-2-like isoform X1 n=2 Tax=Polyodon spathula TaxID=7913 RepID=UPI001B7F3C6D|nr:myozenin-2-like isoform X1 [Polyodon spathula]XP_041122477.1 myozenin-2-like isoform X1 [Polyodon spathula]